MKLCLTCMRCLQEFGKPNLKFMSIELNDNGTYLATCDIGRSHHYPHPLPFPV